MLACIEPLAYSFRHSASRESRSEAPFQKQRIEPPERFPHAIEVVAIDLANLGRKSAIIDRPNLIEAEIFILLTEVHMHLPCPLPQLRRCGGDEVKTVGQLSEYKDRTREAIAFAVDLRPDVLSE